MRLTLHSLSQSLTPPIYHSITVQACLKTSTSVSPSRPDTATLSFSDDGQEEGQLQQQLIQLKELVKKYQENLVFDQERNARTEKFLKAEIALLDEETIAVKEQIVGACHMLFDFGLTQCINQRGKLSKSEQRKYQKEPLPTTNAATANSHGTCNAAAPARPYICETGVPNGLDFAHLCASPASSGSKRCRDEAALDDEATTSDDADSARKRAKLDMHAASHALKDTSLEAEVDQWQEKWDEIQAACWHFVEDCKSKLTTLKALRASKRKELAVEYADLNRVVTHLRSHGLLRFYLPTAENAEHCYIDGDVDENGSVHLGMESGGVDDTCMMDVDSMGCCVGEEHDEKSNTKHETTEKTLRGCVRKLLCDAVAALGRKIVRCKRRAQMQEGQGESPFDWSSLMD